MRAALLALLLVSCSSPDEFSLSASESKTRYPDAHSFDSRGVGAEARLSWDLGRRADAHTAQIELGDRLERAVRNQPPAVVPGTTPPKPTPSSLPSPETIAGGVAALAAIAGTIKHRKRIGEAISRPRRKVSSEPKPRHPVEQ